MNDFYNRQRTYRSLFGESTHISNLANTKLTLDIRDMSIFDRQYTGHKTPFREIEITPYDETATRVPVIPPSAKAPLPLDKFCDDAYENYKRVIEATWDHSKVHVITHSSGYDSRICSLALRDIVNEKGEGWLGTTIFLEADGEAEPSRVILKRLGFDDKLVVYNEGVDPNEYHAMSLEFKNAWRHLNCGMVTFPVNRWYTPIEALQNNGILPGDDKIQCYTGYGANETAKAIRTPMQNLNWYFWWHYHHQLSTFPLKGSWVHPFYHLSFLNWLDIHWPRGEDKVLGPADSLSKLILSVKFPDIYVMPKMNTADVRRAGYNTPSERIFNRAVNTYYNSWLYRTCRPDVEPVRDIEYYDWWGVFGLASFCDFHIQRGGKIEV